MSEKKDEKKTAGRYVGLDLAKRTIEVCIVQDGAETIRHSGVKTDPTGRERLARMLRKDDTVAMETCGYAFFLSRFLGKRVGCRVLILNAGSLQVIWKSLKKTDKEDARKIAQLVQRTPESELPVVALPTEKEEALRRQISFKNYLKRMRTSLINRLHTVFLDGGIVDKKRVDLATAKRRQESVAELSGRLREDAQSICLLLETVEKELKAAKKEIEVAVSEHELSPYVMSIPGVGPEVTAAFLAHVGDGSRFNSPAEVANYVALTPVLDCSGQSEHYGHIGKNKGCRALRSVILQSAWSLLKARDGGRLQAKFFLMQERIGKTRSAVAIARRIVGLMWLLAKRREFYADARREGLERKFRRYKVNYGGWDSVDNRLTQT